MEKCKAAKKECKIMVLSTVWSRHGSAVLAGTPRPNIKKYIWLSLFLIQNSTALYWIINGSIE